MFGQCREGHRHWRPACNGLCAISIAVWQVQSAAAGSRRNVAHHYDLDGRLYSLFLDADRQYSCAYFETPDQSLDDAQLAKKRHLAAKLLLGEGQRVLDIGCGWGGLALYLAEFCGAHVTGITLSEEQPCIARTRGDRGLAGAVEFRLQDYRDLNETFDRIVSVGMFEHVGAELLRRVLPQMRRRARRKRRDAAAFDRPLRRARRHQSVDREIHLPGGYIPALSEVLPAIERAGLLITDIEIPRLHYAEAA